MAPMSEEDLAWFKSTFRPIPKPELPDDCIEYSLHWIPAEGTVQAADAPGAARSRLSEVQKYASELTKKLLKDYIWQRDAFKLEFAREDGVELLRGKTGYGDSIEDEWVIVYILRELTQRFDDAWVKVTDSDGEFLLVEAAATLPEWLEPVVADNRVWINKGRLIIIKPNQDIRRTKTVTEKITFRDAKEIIMSEPKRFMHSQIIEDEAFYRLRNYPKQIEENLHTARVTIPRKIAHLLHLKPAYVSPAVDAFYVRDPISLRPLQGKSADNLTFPPEDLITVSVRFTRVGYAQLKSQDFATPQSWKDKLPRKAEAKEYSGAETGMKLSCGFEMLLADPQSQDKAAVREMKLVLEDLETGDDKLPTDEEIEKEWEKREDDEKWMDISFEDLEGELKGQKNKSGGAAAAKPGAFGDQTAQENLQRIVAQFEQFLNDDSAGFDGADLINEGDSDDDDDDDGSDDLSSDGEDQEASFDEEEFSRMMQEMMGMPPEVMEEIRRGEIPNNGESSSRAPAKGKVAEIDTDESGDDNDDDVEQIQELSKQMEAELRGTGVLDLNPRASKIDKGKAAIRSTEDSQKSQQGENGDTEHDDADEEDFDVNLARNLLESFQSQAGSAGPAGNLMGMMGMKLPKGDRG
ncbi:hypothetical protein AJ80_04414 [Polytolypa hystricis UAMH7299]|uniref:Regulatory factor Sgt1 n=1 Tax=Polytolypa hystricis (strain UAMH7299) TaxID=1447883 RepID=A0A2B7YAV3_POLH7|nr:hypothetical protein AJ80_04414 [Polytolypa hystricis UAMH7299]